MARASVVANSEKSAWWHLPLSSVWGVTAVVVPVLLVTAARMGCVDLTYHLRAGALMLESRALVRVDTFTFTANGLPWVDQQWLSQLFLASVFRIGGWFGLAVVRSFVALLALVFVFLACQAAGADRRPAAWLTLGGAALLLPTLQLRPQLFGVASFALALWLLAGRRERPWRLVALVPLMLLWANLHGTFFLLIGLIGLAWLHDVRDRHPGAWRLVALGFACIAATFVNPYGIGLWRYVLELSGNAAVRGMVLEWQPTSVDSFSGAAFLISVPMVTLLLARSHTPLSWPVLLSAASFFAIGLMSVRGVYWWAMAAPVLLATSGVGRRGAPKPDPVHPLNGAIVGVVVLALPLVFARWLPFRAPEPAPAKLLTEAPAGMTTALRAELRPGERFFHAQAWGSWFEFALPSNPVVVDSRIELVPADVWKKYADISQGRDGWDRLLEAWQIRVLALSPLQQGMLLERIVERDAWKRIYQDAYGSIFVRR